MKYIAILRGINVGGHRKILMKDLRDLFVGLGYTDVITYIQSGNVIFEGSVDENPLDSARRIESAIDEKFGYDVPVIVVSAAELNQAIAANSYYQSKPEDIAKFHLTFLSETPAQNKVELIKDIDFFPDQFEIEGRSVYLSLGGDGKYHKTKLNNQFFEKKLSIKATTRNWKTVLKLAEMVGGDF